MDVGVGTRCVLFTDFVASTELRIRLGEERADELQRRHDSLLAEALAGHGGAVLKYLGDGVLATFESAAEGVAAAVAVQQAVSAHAAAHPGLAFSVRIGLSVGDVSLERDDVFGTAVVEAARLCTSANGGEIFVADIVRALARGRGGFVFEPIGELDLKGLPEPVPACKVTWAALEADVGVAPLPPLLVGGATVEYVGREAVLARLRRSWSSVREGHSATVLIGGEPGIGKTRTSAEVAMRAHREGALVLYGRCEEGLNLPYQPFVEALDHHTRHVEAAELGRLPGELARLLPDLASRVRNLPPSLVSDPRTEEHRLLSAVSSWLVEASRAHGIVLVVDDLHWATPPTVLMLLHVVREAAATEGARLMVIGTFRDSDLDPEHPFAHTLGDLAPVPGVLRIALRGLSDAEIARFLEEAAGHDLDDDGLLLARMLHAETEGNPFFVGEVIRHLIETGVVRREGDRWVVPDVGALSVPEGVRDVIIRRLSRLGEATRQVLTVAAVVGRDIDVDVLCGVADHGEDVVIDALDEALRARLVEETGPDHYRFSHALLRTTLYDQLSATRRRRVHRRTASVLEKLRPDDVIALAYHFVEGGPEHGDTSRGVHYTLAAAEQSLEARALAEAEARFRTALELLEDDEHGSPADRLDALFGLGISMRDQGRHEFREVLLDASRRAHVLGDVPRQVRAVLANSRGTGSVIGATDQERVAEIEAALASLGDDPAPERARLLARLASELATDDFETRGMTLAAEALALARGLGDEELVGEVLYMCGTCFFALERSESLPALFDPVIAEADHRGDPTARVWSRLQRAAAAWTLFDLATDARLRREAREIADQEGLPVLQWATRTFGVAPLIMGGRLAEAEALANEALAIGQAAGEPDAGSWWAATLVPVVWVRDGAGTMADAAGQLAEQFPGAVGWRTFQVFALAHAGRHEEAREVLRRSALDFDRLCRTIWLSAPAAQLAEVAYLLADVDLAGRLLPALRRHAGQFAHVWVSGAGPVDFFIGRALDVLHEHDEAMAHFERAIAACRREGARLWAASTTLGLVQGLAARAAPGDLERARLTRDAALAEAEAMGARWLARELGSIDLSAG